LNNAIYTAITFYASSSFPLAYLVAFSFLAYHLPEDLRPFLTSFTSSNSCQAFLRQPHLLRLGAFHLLLPFPYLASSTSFDSYLAFLRRLLLPSFTRPFSSYLTYLGHLLCLILIIILPYSLYFPFLPFS
jgi:hypothetical protein